MYTKFILVTLAMFLSSSCMAFFGTIEDHAILLTSNDPTEVRNGAESTFDRFGGNRTLVDIAAKRWLLALEDPTSDEAATAWLTKAVGGSGSLRYAMVLRNARDFGTDKAKYWAKLGIRRSQVPAPLFDPEDVDLVAIRTEMLTKTLDINLQIRAALESNNEKLVRQTAERMYFMASILDEPSLDAASAFIIKHLETPGVASQSAAWLCRMLGKVGRPQDLDVLSRAASQGTPKLKKYAAESHRQLVIGLNRG